METTHIIHPQQQSPTVNKTLASQGFTLTEVLVAALILTLVVMVVFRVQLDSAKRTEQSAELNQIQNLIRQDLNALRHQARRWQCASGTACTGRAEDLDTPVRYSTTHCASAEPLSDFPVSSGVLSGRSGTTPVERQVNIKGTQLEVTYIGSSRGQTIRNSTILIPPAMHWCG